MPNYYIQGTSIRAYSYDAAYHCLECSYARFGDDLDNVDTTDSEGNPVHPIFWSDELRHYEHCDDCNDDL